jgi:hypothetical protein
VGALSDYTTETKAIFLNLALGASEKLDLYLDGTYALSEGSFDPFEMPEPEDQPGNWANDFSGVNQYSDLDYRQVEATLGASYLLDERASVYGSVTWYDFEDDEAYVYGDLDGQIIMYATGMTVRF